MKKAIKKKKKKTQAWTKYLHCKTDNNYENYKQEGQDGPGSLT